MLPIEAKITHNNNKPKKCKLLNKINENKILQTTNKKYQKLIFNFIYKIKLLFISMFQLRIRK